MTNRLLSLELQGYKTFASSTAFEFPGQVTAVVGPNGSGKSNIADAVRWVLGEQAYSLLRGKKTEDMIFSGSQQRPRASMASVSIRFNNEDGWLPVDFAEVSITRRAYRSGENEYMLNNQRVRLKEINELLANSGLGERNYTIIGQGLIDNALSLKPDERRKFIEEAAGIDLYRARREEATQKLDKTLHNMERANDILSELKPRLNNLTRSKEKTIQYKQVQSDLSQMLKEWYGYHWHKAQAELREARAFYQKQKSEFEQAKNEIERKENELNLIQANLHQNRSQLADLHKQVSNYHLQIEDITKNTAVLDEREKSLKDRIAELENEIEITKSQRENYHEDLTKLETESKNIQVDLEIAKQQFVAAENAITKKLSEKVAQETKVAKIQKEILSRQTNLLELNSRISGLENQISQNKKEISEIEEFLKRAEKELGESNDRRKNLQQKLDHNKAEQKEKTSLVEEDERSARETSQLINALTEKKQEKNGLLSTISAELRVLKDAEENLEGFTSGSATLLTAAKENRIRSKISAILQHLEIPEKYELAVAAGMGEMLEGIVLEERENPEDILRYMETHQIPRTSFFSGIIGKKVTTEKLDFNGHFMAANTLVKGETKTSEMIRDLLSKTLIVDNRSDALAVYDQLKPGWKLVTLIGEVFDANGIITAGAGNRTQPIRRKREKKQLESEAEFLKVEIDRVDQELFIEKGKQTELQTQLIQNRGEVKRLQDLIYSEVMDLQRLDLETDQKKKNIDKEKNRKQQLKSLINSLHDQISSLKAEIGARKQEIDDLQPMIDQNVVIVLNSEIEMMRKDILELSSRKAVSEELDNRQNESIRFLQTSINRTENKLMELKTLLESQINTLSDTGLTKNSLSSNYELITAKIDKVNQDITPLESKVESIIGQQGEIVQIVDESRKQFAIVERHTMQAQIRVDKLQDQLEFIKQKIEEDFGLISDYEGRGFYADQPLPLEEIVAKLPESFEITDGFEPELNQKKSLLRRLGPVNPDADKEFEEVNERFNFLTDQLQDLQKAETDLRQVVRELDDLMQKKFIHTFTKVNEEFKDIFGQLFSGGSARLMIADENNALDGGLEIEATLPGKRRQELALLSGGERSLTAVALIFALLRISPTPFCILDEVDAMLDESNVVKFGEMLRDLSDSTQFIVITHNRNTVQLADILYGVTMGKDSVSQVISLKMDELTEEMVQ